MNQINNARFGAQMMYVDRWFLRRCIWNRKDNQGKIKGLRNMVFPRISFHLIYLRKFGLKRWWFD